VIFSRLNCFCFFANISGIFPLSLVKSSDPIRDFQRLSLAPKTVFFGSILAGSAVFLPWITRTDFATDDNGRFSEIIKTGNGFDLFPIFGILSLLGAVTVFFVFARFFLGSEKTLGFSAAKIWTFLGGEMLFVLVLALFVFASRNAEDSTAVIRFGLPLSILAYAVIFAGGYLAEREEFERRERSLLSPSASPGHLGIRPEPLHVSRHQLSLADTHERK